MYAMFYNEAKKAFTLLIEYSELLVTQGMVTQSQFEILWGQIL